MSAGNQDFNPIVQKAINRMQTVEQVQAVMDMLEKVGGFKINFDLIYGLPFQTQNSIKDAMDEIIKCTLVEFPCIVMRMSLGITEHRDCLQNLISLKIHKNQLSMNQEQKY